MNLFKNFAGIESIKKRRELKDYQKELSRIESYKNIY